MSPGHSFWFALAYCYSTTQVSNIQLAPHGLGSHDLGLDRYQRTPPFAPALAKRQSRAQRFQYNSLDPGICLPVLEYTFHHGPSLHASHMV